MKNFLILLFFSAVANSSFAIDWSLTVGLSSASNRSSPPEGSSKVRAEMIYSSITNKLDEKTTLGGSFSTGNGRSNNSATDGKSKADVTNIGLFLIKDVGSLRFLDVSLGYGSVATNGDIDGGNVNFNFDGSSSSLSLGVTQYVPIKSTMFISLNARTSYMISRGDAYQDTAGTSYESSKQSKSMNSIGGGISRRYARWTPSANFSYVFSNREHTVGLSDKDFYRYSFGLGYKLASDVRINFGYGGVFDKSANKENTIRVAVTSMF
jgi:hypothetical protein